MNGESPAEWIPTGYEARTCRRAIVLAGLIQGNGWTRGAEIGVLGGSTFKLLLQHCPRLKLIGVDRWEWNPPSATDGAETYTKYDMRQSEAAARRIAAEYPGRATLLKGDLVEMAAQVLDGSLDFVFLDADHTEAGTVAAIRAWAPKLHVTGALLGHDWNWPSVARALDAELPVWEKLDGFVWRVR